MGAHDEMENQRTEVSPAPAGCLLRLLWMFVGHGALYLALGTIAATRAPLPSYLDGIAGASIVLILGLRYLDITRFAGSTAQGEPATLADWRRHAVWLIGVTIPIWLLAHWFAG